ncbi:MAG: HlyD family efflux transporter periplasmic adaptor subunit [Pseudomonadota bacterium]
MIALLAGCGDNVDQAFPGYAEGEYVRIAAPFAGSLSTLSARRGEQVGEGAALFALEQESEKAARSEARERLRRAEAQYENLTKGKRPDEIAAIEAQQFQAAAAQQLSEIQLHRQEKLFAAGASTHQMLDEAHAAYQRDTARASELAAQLRIARLGARRDEIDAAAAEVSAARAALAQAEWKLAQKSVKAPLGGLIADTYYVQGEWVPAGSPVVSLLPPQNIKVRFFVPETVLAQMTAGRALKVNCDACGAALSARVSFISPQAEYTPPVIYSKENRARLVYLVEAELAPQDATRLHPGQPLDVTLP